jgi:ankyrin repeat protein
MMRLLLDKGADVNAVNSEGATPLHLGVKSGHGTMVAELLQRGADPARTDAAGWLPLHYAVNAGDEECLRILLEAEKQLDSHVQRLTRSGSCPGAAPGL